MFTQRMMLHKTKKTYETEFNKKESNTAFHLIFCKWFADFKNFLKFCKGVVHINKVVT